MSRTSSATATTAIRVPATTNVGRGPSSVPPSPPRTIAANELPRTIPFTVASTRPRQKSGVRLSSSVLASTLATPLATPTIAQATANSHTPG